MFFRVILLYIQIYGKKYSNIFFKNSNTFLGQKYSYNFDKDERF